MTLVHRLKYYVRELGDPDPNRHAGFGPRVLMDGGLEAVLLFGRSTFADVQVVAAQALANLAQDGVFI